jgi:hypothetical protein
VALYKAPPFVALSYCWGDLKNKTHITVNDLEVFVTVNLHAALRRLRAEGIEFVWVDFLCINQRDSEERSIQIGRMGMMFKQAKQVVVWLGDEQDIKEDDITSLSAAGAKMARHALPVSARRTLNKLLSRPYWTRVWIIQELAAASNIIILCGRHKLSWEIFSSDSHNEYVEVANDTNGTELETRFQKICQFRIDKLTGRPISLPNALYRSQSALATDARDKLYALLGLVFDGDRFIPQPNYDLSIEETYTNFSTALIEKGLPLDFIYLRTSNRGIHDSLPSWVVDWSDLNDALAREEFRHISTLPAFSTSHLNQQNQAHASKTNLVVHGSIFGTIDGLSSAFLAGESDFVGRVGLTPGKQAAQVQPDFDYSGYIFEALIEPQRLSAAGVKLPPSPVRLWSSSMKAELGEWVDGHMSPSDLKRLSDWFDENRSLAIFGRTMEDWDRTWTSQPNDQGWRLSQSTCLRALLTTIISGMRFAILESGELGWVHPQSQKGDEIAKVVGCDRYIVLRPDLQGYRVIGEARPHWLASEPELLDTSEESLKIF